MLFQSAVLKLETLETCQRKYSANEASLSPQCGGLLSGDGGTDGQWERGHWQDPERKGKLM